MMRVFLSILLVALAAQASVAAPAPVIVPAARETAPVEVVAEPGQTKVDAADDPAIIVGST
ncbi:MAG: hypothetical protein SGI91_01735, partial [Alphaproteobacteria bacterium]|nr:hypothetical protein [Alphaproteobacteria bacterium]